MKLNYGLPDAGQGRRWFIKQGYGKEVRYLHLQEKKWWGWKKVHYEYIGTDMNNNKTFEESVRKAAKEVIYDLQVNFVLPKNVEVQ